MRCLACVVVSIATACGGGGDTPVAPDAQPDMTIDAPVFPACREFANSPSVIPAHVVSSLAASDVLSPQCTTVDAPYGILSSGPDAVVPLMNLMPGTAYIVQLRSPADLAFYVVTGCSTASGPAATECALFVDASTGDEELGRFVATSTTAYVVIDYYRSASPSNQTFTLDVYTEMCTSNAQCAGTPATPVCTNGRCVECGDSFDCHDAAKPLCDTTLNLCSAGVDACETDDASEPEDDGPTGAFAFVPDVNGLATQAGEICSSPRSEADFFSFEVAAPGEIWNLSLDWTGTRDIDLEVLTPTGEVIGLSYWEHPEVMRLSHLPVGTYFVKVSDFSNNLTLAVPYTLSAQRTAGAACAGPADCAIDYRNQLFRGDCEAGVCVAITGNGAVAQGGACDSLSDCVTGLTCPSFYFVANADTRNVCVPTCTADAACAALGTDYVCDTIQKMCVQKCTTDDQCPVDLSSQPVSGPWYRRTCQLTTGRCIP